MSKRLAILFGFTMVVAHVPTWSQPSIEPKSALVLAVGAMAWGWLAWRGRPMANFPWALLLPVSWLMLSAFWSPSPFLGMQRILWLLAALGIGTLLAAEAPFDSFMTGFLAGTGLHAALILMQWIHPIRVLLPPSLGVDPFQGIGRGLFHNTNMAALPFIILVGWVLLSERGRARVGHLVWVLPALALTQSRLGIGICSALLAYALVRRRGFESKPKVWLNGLGFLLTVAWSLTAHRWGWILPLSGTVLAIFWKSRAETDRVWPRGIQAILPALGLGLALLAGVATPTSKNAAQTVVQGTLIHGDVSLSQRLSYYRVAALAFLDRPFIGQGLGSARSIYPRFVDRNHPAAEIAYGDFLRPNNFHSEPLELLSEGGLPLVLLVLLGLWLDRRSEGRRVRWLLLVPPAVIALMDFPFHNPVGILWMGITLGASAPMAPWSPTQKTTRFTYALLSLWLLGVAVMQVRVAQGRLEIERRYLARQDPQATHDAAQKIWNSFPYSADLFDLYSKSAIQAAVGNPGPESSRELDTLLAYDPYDHHLLLARAQLARRLGDGRTAQGLLVRYSAVAPLDPDRYLRLARDAFQQGKFSVASQLLEEAKKQPGFNSTQQERIDSLLTQMASKPH